MKVLITGGAGFIGSRLAKKFLVRGDEVIILDNLLAQVHGEGAEFSTELKENCDCVLGDVRDKALVQKLVSRSQGVMHMVAETGMGQSMYQIERYADVNVRATGIILDCIATCGKDQVQKVFIPSSSRVYGEGHWNCETHGDFYPNSRSRKNLDQGIWSYHCPVCEKPMAPMKNRETDKVTPTSIYGITKHNQEQMLLVFGRAHGIPCYSMRYQNVFGPGQSLLNPYTGVLNVFAQQIQNRVIPEIYEEGHPVRDFILVDDIVDCTMEGFFNDNSNGKVFNVGRGEPMPIADVGKIIMKLMGMEGDPIMSKKYRVGDVLFGCADMTAARNDLNWQAKFTSEEGIKLFVESLKDKGPLKDYSDVAENELIKAGLMGRG